MIKGLLLSYIGARLHNTFVTSLPPEWLSFESLVGSIAGLSIGMLWQKGVRRCAIKYFAVLAIAESICGCSLGLYLALVKWNIWFYAIVSLIYQTFISEFVTRCFIAFRSRLWNNRGRENYDNNHSIVRGISCIIGYSLALIAMPTLKLSLILWAICCVLDDGGWVFIYFKNHKILKDI